MTISFPWLCFLVFLPSLVHSIPSSFTHPPPQCHHFESSALLYFKNSLSLTNDKSYYISYCAFIVGVANPNSTMSWDMSRDCCTWSGVTCDDVTGHVIGIELRCSGLQGVIHSNNSLFSLTHLQTLTLSNNLFDGSKLSPLFRRFVSMIHLDLSGSGFRGQVPLEFSYLSSLVTLDLSENPYLRLETFSLRRILANLTSIRKLSLSHVNMSYLSPNSFMNFSVCMTSLDLSSNGLKGEFPENVFRLPNLQKLTLSENYNLTGSFPENNWTSPLRNLSLSSTRFLINLPYLTRNLKYLNHLYVSNCIFSGSFPVFLSNITQITSLDLSRNNFGGQFPWNLLNMGKLTFLDLSYNNFEGQLPEICSNSTKITFLCDSSKHQLVGPLPLNLKYFVLSNNLLNGTIPSWLCSLPSLQYLDLNNNQFTGPIDEFQYNSLSYLDLSLNNLWGLIPMSIFQQINLSHLDLSSNSFSGVVRSNQISNLKNLHILDISFNSLSMGFVNTIISASPSTLQELYLSSCDITEFPYSLKRLQNLEILELSNNRIKGSAPPWLWNVGKDSLYVLNISNNNLAGELSSSFCNLTGILLLDLSKNSLSGNIPPCLVNFSYLLVLNLRMNKFQGMIPQYFKKGKWLSTVNLEGNQLEGPLPRSLVNCESLEFLDVGNNKLNGSFPFWLESLPELRVLVLRSNRFSGPIRNPKVRFPFQKLRIIDVSNNEFTGLLPTEYFQSLVAMMDTDTYDFEYMRELTSAGYYQDSLMVNMKGFYFEMPIHNKFICIDFSQNHFIGEIPSSIGKLRSLKGLDFSRNGLTSSIPASLGNITSLEWLDLSSNDLSGQIPPELLDLTGLEFLNLSLNKLVGPIPTGKQFNTFENNSYIGNVGLCGFPMSESCGNHETRQDQDDDDEHGSVMFDWKVVMIGYGCGLVIGISFGYMVLFSPSFDYWFLKKFGGRRRQHISIAPLRGQ